MFSTDMTHEQWMKAIEDQRQKDLWEAKANRNHWQRRVDELVD